MWRIRTKRLRWGCGWRNWRNRHARGGITHFAVFSSLGVLRITAGVAGLVLSESYPCPEGPPPSHVCPKSTYNRCCPQIPLGWLCHVGDPRIPLFPISHVYVLKSQPLSALTPPSPSSPAKVNHLSRH